MRLRDFLDPTSMRLDLDGALRDEVLVQMVQLIGLIDRPADTVVRQLIRREAMGSTGFGGGVAIPHCRTLAVNRLRVAFGRHPSGVEWGAADRRPVHALFLIVAPPMEVSNQYLPVLGRLAQLLHEPGIPERLRAIAAPADLFTLIEAKGL